MLSQEQNEMLTRVGKGTPMGELLRRYWFPVGTTADLKDKYTKKVRLLGEDLVLYRDRSGNIGLIQEKCPHRGVSMVYGFPEEEGLRCQYHGWCFNNHGQCTDQPNEPEESTFKDRVKISAYPIQEMGGLYWTYMGPEPAPLLPRFDGFALKNSIRLIGQTVIPVNWLQIMENSMDPIHTEWLHGHYDSYQKEMRGEENHSPFLRKHDKIAFDRFEYGLVKRRLLKGMSEDTDDWKVGHPVLFPYTLSVGGTAGPGSYAFQMRIPMDDTHTWHVWYTSYAIPDGVEIPESLQGTKMYDVPYLLENGEYRLDFIDGQDIMCWITQGSIADRTDEKLGTTDKGIILYRQVLKEQIDKVAAGEDPLGTVRDPEKNLFIQLPLEKKKHHFSHGFRDITTRFHTRFAPNVEELIEFFEKREKEEKVGSH